MKIQENGAITSDAATYVGDPSGLPSAIHLAPGAKIGWLPPGVEAPASTWVPPKRGAYNPFPLVDPGLVPFGSRVLVQFRTPPTVTAGGVHLADEAIEAEKWNTQVGIVMAIGPLAFQNRSTREPWPEGSWANLGDLVRCPKYGGDRWEMQEQDLRAFFALFNDLDLLGRVTVGPDRMRAFV